MKKCFLLAWVAAISLTSFAEDEYQVLSKRIGAYVESFVGEKERDDCIGDFQECWRKAKNLYDKEMISYLSSSQRAVDLRNDIENNKLKIIANKNEIGKLSTLSRGEFEEHDDFKKRQNQSAWKIGILAKQNEKLEQENVRLKDSIDKIPRMEKPKLSLKFLDRFEFSGTGDCEVCEIGQYNIDTKKFPCRFRFRLDKEPPELEKFDNFAVESSIECGPREFQYGPFKSTAEARKFKEEFQTGKQKIKVVIGVEINVTSGAKEIKIKDGGERTDYKKACLNCLLGAVFAVKCIAQGSSDNVEMPDFQQDTYRFDPTYKTYDTYFINCNVSFKPTL